MNHRKTINFLFLILTIQSSNYLFAQKIYPKERYVEPDHVIFSEIMNQNFHLFISFPKDYNIRDTISYPILYFLDGHYYFESFRSAQKYLQAMNEIEGVIIVGIGMDTIPSAQVNRINAYSPSVDTITERLMEAQLNLGEGSLATGNANKFYACIKSEITPFIDRHYKITSDIGIAGHSMGGLFAAFCILHNDGFFSKIGVNSPSLFWDSEKLLTETVQNVNSDSSFQIAPVKIYGCTGKFEGPEMIPAFIKFITYLERADRAQSDITWEIFEGETHFSIIPTMICRTIKHLYKRE